MNKEEAKQKLHNLAFAKLDTKPDDLKLADVMRIVNQIYEPKKLVVQQFVADWYEKHKHDLNYHIWEYIYNWHDQEETEFKRWFDCSKNSFETLIGMSHYGYEVEKEKRYLVKVKGVSNAHCLLKYHKDIDRWTIGPITHYNNPAEKHTKGELEKAGFGEVFNSPLFEVQEVEE